jgi:hypothetical protein
MGNLPRNSCAALFIAWGKKSHKCVSNFITDAMVILPYLKIYHGKVIFGKFTMKMRNFGKFTVSFWKIYHEKKQILENLPFYGNISMEIGIMGKFPWIYGTMP